MGVGDGVGRTAGGNELSLQQDPSPPHHGLEGSVNSGLGVVGAEPPAWCSVLSCFPMGLGSRVGASPSAGVGVSVSFPLSPLRQSGDSLGGPQPQDSVYSCVYVCESGSWSGFRRMFFLAGPCGGGGGRGPGRGMCC